MCGPSGSGKSTYARRLEDRGMVRLSFDTVMWERGIKEVPLPPDLRDEIESGIRVRLLALVEQGRDVVLDFSFWSRAMRDDYRRLLAPTGIVPETVYLATDRETVLERIQSRRGLHPDDFVIPDDLAARHFDHFEAPTADEGPLRVITTRAGELVHHVTDTASRGRRRMAASTDLDDYLAGASVDPAVFALQPDYRALLLAVDGIVPAGSDARSESLLQAAEESARVVLTDVPADEVLHVAAWRAAYRAFGAKPQRTRNSLEALMRRAGSGLPRVNRLTDVYNAVSVMHQVPLGGEDLDRYDGAPRLVRATGDESFDTVADGATVIEHPDPGEVVWRDDSGVTCRRWNWRQARRTQLTDETTRALFILDALGPMTDDDLAAAAEALVAHLAEAAPDLVVARRLLGSRTTAEQLTPPTVE